MIRKLRWKVIGLNMIFVAVMLVAVLLGIFFASRSSLERSTRQQLQQALSGSFEAMRPGQGGGAPCFVAEVLSDGVVRVFGSSSYNLEDEDTLLEIVQACLDRPEDAGVLPSYHLRYLRQDGLFQLRIAFTDSTMEENALRSLMLTSFLGGLAALVVLFLFSYLLSGLVTRPVGQAWDDQKRFLSDASHELKTPLTVILSSAELLEGTVAPEGAPYVDNIRSEGLRMKALVEDMLSLSRAEGMGHPFPHTSLDLSDLTTEAVLRFEPVAFEARRELASDVAPGLRVCGSGEQLTRLLGVLLDNAIKYAPEHSAIQLRLTREGRNAQLVVENGGEVIPPEKLAHLFDRFYQVDEARSGGQGFGLGLAIAQAIAAEHGGAIRCESDARSTRFYVTLPLEK
jgi:signal transduction histidine kinase